MDRKLQKGIVAVLIANIVNVFFSLATNFLLPKFLSIESYAGIKEFQLYVSYVGLFHFGFVDGIYLKYGGKNLEKKVDSSFYTDLSTMRVFQVIITLVVLIVAFILKDRILIFFALSIFPQNMANYFKFLYQAIGEFNLYGKAMNMTTISTFVLNMILLFILKTDNVYWYVLGYIVLYFVIWLILEKNFYTKHVFLRGRYFSLYVLFDNIKTGFLLTLGNLSSIFLTSMDRWFVKALMNTFAFAQYSFSVSVENFLNLAITPVTTTLYNYFCRQNDENEHKRIYNYVVIFATIVPAAAFPIQLILLFFLKKYIDASKTIFLLFSAQIFYTVIKAIYVNLYKVQRKQKMYFIKLIIILLVGFLLNCACYAIIKRKEAFAVGTLLSSIVWFFISEVDFKYICPNLKVHIYLFLELIIFLFLGFNFMPIVGGGLYILLTILLCSLFMRETFDEALTKGKKLLIKIKEIKK